VPIEWHQLKRTSYELSSELELTHLPEPFTVAVGSEHLRERSIHRWFTYKEGFSPSLLGLVIERLGLEGPLRVADPFGGVATTALAGLTEPAVIEVRSVEYSPFARFVGETKLLWPCLDPDHLAALLPAALAYDRHREVAVPDLAAFSNREIFSGPRIRTLLAARDHLFELDDVDQPERDFFLLGLAAVLEDLSGAMKDGRALRIKGTRSRRASSLASSEPLVEASGVVKRALAGQWSAMIADLRTCEKEDRERAFATPAHHLSGDARKLDTIKLFEGGKAFPAGWADLSLFSPPYLNCIDYTELYKLELWFMGHIRDGDSCVSRSATTSRTLKGRSSNSSWDSPSGSPNRDYGLRSARSSCSTSKTCSRSGASSIACLAPGHTPFVWSPIRLSLVARSATMALGASAGAFQSSPTSSSPNLPSWPALIRLSSGTRATCAPETSRLGVPASRS